MGIHSQNGRVLGHSRLGRYAGTAAPGLQYTGGDGKEHAGPGAAMAIAQMYAAAFPDGRLEIVRDYALGATAIAEMVVTGHQTGQLMNIAPTGKFARTLICNVMELRDGKVYREREYFDAMAMMVQLGVVPDAEAAGA